MCSAWSRPYGGGNRGFRGGPAGRGGRGRGFDYNRPPRRFRLHIFTNIDDTNELTLRLVNSLPEFKDFVGSDSMSLQDTFDLLKVLSRVLDNELHHGSVVKIMHVICKSRFLDSPLPSLVRALPSQQTKLQREIIENILALASHICQNLQPFSSKGLLLISAVQNARHVVTGLGMVVDVQRVKAQCETCISALQRQARARRGPNDDEEIPPEDFTELPIFPSVRDMDWTEDHFLRANKEAGAFRDVHHYLDVQFRLLREDYIRPLRNGIREYQEKRQRNEATGQIQDVRLYYQVQILELVCDQHLEHRLQFDNTQFQNMRWQSSKRLIYGSLVCLSHDDFKTIYFAVVTNRDVKDLENGIIQVKFENCLEKILELSGNEVFTMAECVTFFEAHRHVLKGMQEMAQNQRGFPMSPYIVECRSEVAPPKYLKTADGRVYTMDLKSIMRNENNPRSHHVNVLRPSSWPSLADTPFNQSQLDAVKTALTKELTIIQGPPGTGKTYVGLKIAKVLLDNRGVWNEPDNPRPILVVCYTNHALDQFLEGILKFQSKGIVRVGGQSKSEELKGLNLKLIKEKKRKDKQVNLSTRNSIKDCYRERDGIREQLEKASAKLEATRRGVVRENVLTSHMHPNHRSSLTRQRYGYRQRSVMVEWLTAGAAVAVDDAEECRRLKQEITAKILNGEGTMDDETTNPDNVLGLPFAERAKLYRHWRDKMSDLRGSTPEFDRKLKIMVRTEILPDRIIKHVAESEIFASITTHIASQVQESLGRLTESNYCIRAWLGIPEFSQDLHELQDVLEKLDMSEDALLNVDEEAMILERQRQLDDDDDDDEDENYAGFRGGRKRQRYNVKDAIADLGVDTRSISVKLDAESASRDGWTVASFQRKKQVRRLHLLLRSEKPMTEEEAAQVRDVWSESLGVKDRVRLYLYWLRRYQAQLREEVKPYAFRYVRESTRLAELRFGEDCDILQDAVVIGMTTSGASRYRKVLDSIGCPIVILEEAAEVLEAHVLTTLNQSCQHLILIGDHQQLRPSPTVYELCRHYQLDLSLFERLVNNELPHSTLAVQHRMRPEVARLVRHVYPHLKDHSTTLDRPHIKGMKEDVFLLHHEVRETSQKDGSSKSNQHEAEFCVRLCKYLLQQQYPPETITILAAYSGQVSAFRKIMTQYGNYFHGVRVTTIDNYQGEENDVIILSLVRSNEANSVGFLGTDNRVCVALSRARNGLYAFGNFKLLQNNSGLWSNIVRTAVENGQCGKALVLRCSNHPNVETKVTCGNDFHQVSEGGCSLPCTFRYKSCGHTCGRKCHVYDLEHKQPQNSCKKPCERKCPEGHPCERKCSQACLRECPVIVEKKLPYCGHSAKLVCSKDPEMVFCQEQCKGKLTCGHRCTGICGDCESYGHQSVCKKEVEMLRSCGHLVKGPCKSKPDDTPCTKPCGVELDCGHLCPGKCGQCFGGRVHEDCKEKCGKPLPGCGHKCSLPCGTKCLPCREKCSTKCQHATCELPCGTPCKPCHQPCPWTCDHQPCEATCNEPCAPCNRKCQKLLGCGHRCMGFCGEKCVCPECEKDKVVKLPKAESATDSATRKEHIKLPSCGHIFRFHELHEHLLKLGDVLCTAGGAFRCPACNVFVMECELWRYHRPFQEIRSSRLEKKQELVRCTSVGPHRRQMIKKSLAMLSFDPEQFQSFASRTAVGDLKDIDVNKASALTTQIKLTYVIEKLCDLDEGNYLRRHKDIKEQLPNLWVLFAEPAAHMTDQRRRELTTETRRLARRVMEESGHVLPMHILDAPLDQELCEIGERPKSTRPAVAPRSTATTRSHVQPSQTPSLSKKAGDTPVATAYTSQRATSALATSTRRSGLDDFGSSCYSVGSVSSTAGELSRRGYTTGASLSTSRYAASTLTTSTRGSGLTGSGSPRTGSSSSRVGRVSSVAGETGSKSDTPGTPISTPRANFATSTRRAGVALSETPRAGSSSSAPGPSLSIQQTNVALAETSESPVSDSSDYGIGRVSSIAFRFGGQVCLPGQSRLSGGARATTTQAAARPASARAGQETANTQRVRSSLAAYSIVKDR